MRAYHFPTGGRTLSWLRDLAMATLVIAIVSACVLLGLEMHDA